MGPFRMMRLLAAVLAATVFGAGFAHAAEDKSDAKQQTIQLEAVALPIIVKGALLNYVFVSIRLELAPS